MWSHLARHAHRKRSGVEAVVEDFVAWAELPGWGSGLWARPTGTPPPSVATSIGTRSRRPRPYGTWSSGRWRAREAGSSFLFPQVRAARVGDDSDGHLSDAAIDRRLLDTAIVASPYDLRRGLSTTCQATLRIPRDTVKMILDHNEGFRTADVLERHHTDDDRLDLKAPLMEQWCAWADEQASIAAAALPPVTALGAELARRRRERELAGKGKRTRPLEVTPAEDDKPGALAAAA